MRKRLVRAGLVTPLALLMLVAPGSTANAQLFDCERVTLTITGGNVADTLPLPPDLYFVEQGTAHFTITGPGPGFIADGRGVAALKGFATDDPNGIVMLDANLLTIDTGLVGAFSLVSGTATNPVFGSGVFGLLYQDTNNREGSCLGQSGLLVVTFP
jgi:hypothetical protein